MRPSAQSASLLRVGCQRGAKPSGDSTMSEPPSVKIALPHSFSQGLMKVPMPAPPGPMRPARASAALHSGPSFAHLREHWKGSTTGSSRSAGLP